MKQPIETQRLVLRPMQESDFDAYYQYASDPEVMKYIRVIGSKDEIKESYLGFAAEWKGEEGVWMGAAVALKDSNELIGDVGFRYHSIEHQQIELGYKFNRKFHGKGYGSEAVEALVKLIIKDWPFHKLVAFCDPRNAASYKIMQRFGMLQEGHFKEHFKLGDEWQDELAYGVLKRNIKI